MPSGGTTPCVLVPVLAVAGRTVAAVTPLLALASLFRITIPRGGLLIRILVAACCWLLKDPWTLIQEAVIICPLKVGFV